MVNEGLLIREQIGARWVMPFGVAVTGSKLVMPDGEVLEGRGVTPDVPCIPSAADLREDRDPCLEKAVSIAQQHSGTQN